MAVVIGTDEAGYGPNLGPLLISATIWRVPDDQLQCDLYERLAEAVSPDPKTKDRIAVADSKDLYKPRSSLGRLESGLLSALQVCCDQLPKDWEGLWETLAPNSVDALKRLPWHQQHHAAVPTDACPTEIEEKAKRLGSVLASTETELLGMASRAVFPEEFNAYVEQQGNKAELLSVTTLRLIESQMALAGDEPILIQCDKHGGRNRYAALLQERFHEHWVEVVSEGRDQSVYRWGPQERRVEIRFTAKGERFLPSALASMACKYLRELAMESFNQYWGNRVENLKPTAGYPVDAKRFHAAIADQQQQLGISDHVLWRSR